MKKLILFALLVVLVLIFAFLLLSNNSKPITSSTSSSQNSPTQLQETDNLPQVTIIAENLDTPWAIAFLPDQSMFITERKGQVRFISREGSLQSNPVAVLSQVKEFGEGGLMGIALHPNFSSNHYVYLYYTYSSNGDNTLNRVVRMTLRGEQYELADEKIIIDAIPGAIFHDGGRIKFGPDGLLYVTTGDATEPSRAQDRNSLAGKMLRVTDEGKPAPGNPYNNLTFSYGHRNPQGITWDNANKIWATEHGPSGIWPNCCQDEINHIETGANYGWPDSVGDRVQSGTTAPILHSGREIWGPSGVAFYNGALFFAGLRGEALYEYRIDEKRLVEHFKNQFGRLREVVLGPDNLLYITTSNRDTRGIPKDGDDKVIRINPRKL